MATNVNKDLDELRDEVSKLRSDITDIADTLTKLAGDAVTDGQNRFRQSSARTREKAREVWGGLEHELEERPLTSVAVAFGLGFVLGKLLDR